MKDWWHRFMFKRLWVTPAINHWQYEHFTNISRAVLDNIHHLIENIDALAVSRTGSANDLNRRLDGLENRLDRLENRLDVTGHRLDSLHSDVQAMHRLSTDNFVAARCKVLLETLQGRVIFLNEDSGAEEATFNTSIVRRKDGFVAAARVSNAAFRNDHERVIQDGTAQYSRIKLFYLSNDFAILRTELIEDRVFRNKFEDARYGFEDLRLFRWKDRMWATAVAVGPGPFLGLRVTQSLICIEGGEITECYLLQSPRNRPWEKNWIPIVEKDDRLVLIYNFDPLILVEFDADEKRLKPIDRSIDKLTDEVKLRGATNLIRIERDLHLCLVRLPNFYLEGKLVYIHKWAVLNSRYEIVETSEPFFLMRRGIEFAAGLIDDEDDLIVSLGVADRRSALLKFSKRRVFDTLITLRT